MTAVKYGSETWTLRKADEDLLDVFQRNRPRMKDYRLPKIARFGQPSRAKRKAGRPCLGWEDVIKKDF